MSASSAILGLGILRFVCLEPRRGRAPQLGSGTSTLPQGVAAQQLTKSMEASGFNQQKLRKDTSRRLKSIHH